MTTYWSSIFGEFNENQDNTGSCAAHGVPEEGSEYPRTGDQACAQAQAQARKLRPSFNKLITILIRQEK
jgi:hypothetical protein